jgi:hypothetical protein
LTYPVPCSPDGQVTEEEQRGESVLGGEDTEKEYEQVRKYLLTNYLVRSCKAPGFLLVWALHVVSNLNSGSYSQLLGRVFNILGENNPGLGGNTHRRILSPAQVRREGPTKTVFVNFMDSCERFVFLQYYLYYDMMRFSPVDNVYHELTVDHISPGCVGNLNT